MRQLVFVVLLAACGGSAAHAPAWPARAEPEQDGGESLEPRTATSIESTASSDDAVATVEAATVSTDKPAEASPTTATPSTTPATVEDVIFTEEITIEIEEE